MWTSLLKDKVNELRQDFSHSVCRTRVSIQYSVFHLFSDLSLSVSRNFFFSFPSLSLSRFYSKSRTFRSGRHNHAMNDGCVYVKNTETVNIGCYAVVIILRIHTWAKYALQAKNMLRMLYYVYLLILIIFKKLCYTFSTHRLNIVLQMCGWFNVLPQQNLFKWAEMPFSRFFHSFFYVAQKRSTAKCGMSVSQSSVDTRIDSERENERRVFVSLIQ